VKVFFDEDNGTGIPRALELVRPRGDNLLFPSNNPRSQVRKGTPDREWIPLVAELGCLVFSQNKLMLENDEERGLLIEHGVGAVYLNNGNENSFAVLRLLLNKWDWLRNVDATVPRPFAFLVSVAGTTRQLNLRSDSPLRDPRPKRSQP